MAPASPQGAAEARSRFTALQNNPSLANKARVEMRVAESAVRLAEQPLSQAEADLGAHRVYLADRRIGIAEAVAKTRLAEEERLRLGEQRDAARLQARTREADAARIDAATARDQTSLARDETSRARAATVRANAEAEAARRSAETARSSAANTATLAARDADEYQRRIHALEAEQTERGLVLTLGDILFATDSATLYSGTNARLDRLIEFLHDFPTRQLIIEGHTDNIGSSAYNQALSRKRADAVRSYLVEHGIESRLLIATGIGMQRPVASNATASGRQQNRRVEIIIQQPTPDTTGRGAFISTSPKQ
jgi:outer membrane protein OmpA-like peptidoglycan-associated protein